MNNEYLTQAEQGDILHRGLVHGEFVLASRARTDMKFDFERIWTKTEEFSIIVNGLSNMIEDCYPKAEAFITIASGATRLGKPLSEKLGIEHIPATKVDSLFGFTLDVAQERDTSVVLVDDIYTLGTNLNKVSKVASNAGLFVIGGAVVLDRSKPELSPFTFRSTMMNTSRLIKYPIPSWGTSLTN